MVMKKNPVDDLSDSDGCSEPKIKKEKVKRKNEKKEKKEKIDLGSAYVDMIDWMEEFQHDDEPEDKEIYCLPWVEKFRPKKLNEVVDHEIFVSTLKEFIKKKQFPHLLLSGPPGTGKTSTIMSCAKELYKDNYPVMVLDINASEERGIDVVRNKIKNFITTKGVFLEEGAALFKLVILDEADAMTLDAQSMLVNIMEKHTLNARFCLICNYIKKINPAIQSRCTIFKFAPLKRKFIENKIKSIADSIGFTVTKDGINTLIKISNGDMRKVINTLQATYMAFGKNVSDLNINKCAGYPLPEDIKQISEILECKAIKDSYAEVYKIVKQNAYSLMDVIHELFSKKIETYLSSNEKNNDKIMNLILNMRTIEANLSMYQNEGIQLSGLIAAYNI
jgi:replication factor C subunit 3/5